MTRPAAAPAFDPARDAIVALIQERHPDIVDVDPAEDLIETRLIDSLQFVEVIVILEDTLGQEIDVATLSVDDFRSLNAIAHRFFPTDADIRA